MKKFLLSLWYDESRFIGVCRGLLMALAEAFRQGVIETGVDGLGMKIAAGLMILSVTFPAGDKNTK